jgi:hypothetical protein
MAVTEDDLWQIKTGSAALVSCLVRALEKSNPSIRSHVLDILSEEHVQFRDHYDGDAQHILQMISWTRKSLKGSDGKPRFLQSPQDNEPR